MAVIGIATETNAIRHGGSMPHRVISSKSTQIVFSRSTTDNFRSTMVIRMGEVFDRIDSAVEREAAARMLCEGRMSDAAREAMSAAVTEYDRRRWNASRRAAGFVSSGWVAS